MKVNLNGQVALVTGAGRGIGQAIAAALAENGARVYFSDIAEDAAEAATQSNSPWLSLDVTNGTQIDAAIERIVAAEGKLDILVNNAGINTMKHRVTIDEFPLDEWERILKVDLTGVYQVSHAAARVMRNQSSGRIINIASIAGIVPLRLQCAYVAAKAGVVNLTKAMALELGPKGILVNAIAPGSILTDGTRQLFYGPDGKFSDSVQRMLDHVPLGRPGTPAEMANGVLFLVDPENTYTTGHILTIDGGWTAGYTRDF